MESEAYYRTRIEHVEAQFRRIKGCRPDLFEAKQIQVGIRQLIEQLLQVEHQIDAEIELIREHYQRFEKKPRLKEIAMFGFGFKRRLRPDRTPHLLQEMEEKLEHYRSLKTRIRKRTEQLQKVDAYLQNVLIKYQKV